MKDTIDRQPVAKDINVPCTDTISRQAAIEAVSNVTVLDKSAARRILTQLPSVEARWIPVTERLPDEDNCTGNGIQYSDDVLMTVANAEDEETIIDYGHTVDGEWYSDIFEDTDCLIPNHWKVTAWMPLPEPYKGEK